MSYTTPVITNTPSELTDGERTTWRAEVEVPSVTALGDVETKADAGVADAATAQAAAEAAQVTADAAAVDSEVVKLSGNQSIDGVKTFTSFPKMNFPSNKTYVGEELVRYSDIVAMISSANPDPAWTALTLVNNWTGTAKYRIVGDYLEIWYSVSDGAASNSIFAVIPSGSALNYTISVQHTNPNVSFFYNTGGNLIVNGYDGISTYTQYQKFIKSAP